MVLTVEGTIVQALELKSGIAKNSGNPWQCQDYIIQDVTESQFSFNVFGEDNIRAFDLKPGDKVSVTLKIEGNMYNGKCYNRISALQCYKLAGNNAPQSQAAPQPQAQPVAKSKPAPQPAQQAPAEDNLPF